MSAETIVLIVVAYLGMVTLVLCLLAMAKRGDRAPMPTSPAERRPGEPPRRRDAA